MTDVTAPNRLSSAAARADGQEAPNGIETTSVAEVVVQELGRQLAAWQQHESGARLGRDPEELHQLRVAVRRIEALLTLFRRQLPSSLATARKGAKAMLRTLGAVRDCDVQLARLDGRGADLPAADRAALVPLRERLEQERERVQLRMLRALDAEPTRHWLQTLGAAPAELSAMETSPALAVMPQRVRRRFRKLKKTVRAIDARASMEDFHTVRRRAKQFRYALECAAVFLGKPAEEVLKALRTLQDELGAHQDADMARRRLIALAAHPEGLPPQTLFLMGRLAEHQSADAAKVRRTLAHAWRKPRKRWRTLRARLQALRELAAARSAATATATSGPAEPDATVISTATPQPLRH